MILRQKKILELNKTKKDTKDEKRHKRRKKTILRPKKIGKKKKKEDFEMTKKPDKK